ETKERDRLSDAVVQIGRQPLALLVHRHLPHSGEQLAVLHGDGTLAREAFHEYTVARVERMIGARAYDDAERRGVAADRCGDQAVETSPGRRCSGGKLV